MIPIWNEQPTKEEREDEMRRMLYERYVYVQFINRQRYYKQIGSL